MSQNITSIIDKSGVTEVKGDGDASTQHANILVSHVKGGGNADEVITTPSK